MDSLSQIALGAALGELVLGRRIGRRAALLGAGLGTLPDLDVLVPYADAVDTFTRHRSWSHSLFVLSAASLPLAALASFVPRRWPPRAPPAGASAGAGAAPSGASAAPPSFGRWWLAVWLVLFTHPLLDGFTVYGTQLFWPLDARPVAIGSVFIIAPLYTLPLAVGVVWAWRRRDALGRRANGVGLALSTAYLALTLVVQAHVERVARRSLAAGGIGEAPLVAVPLPLSVLWRVVALDGDRYLEGWRSLLDGAEAMTFEAHERGVEPLGAITASPAFARLLWFTDGFVRVRERGDELVVTDLRMGAESNYVFSFAVGERDGEGWRPIVARELAPEIDLGAIGQVLRRALDERAFERGEGGR